MDYNLLFFMSIDSIIIDYNPLKIDYFSYIFMPIKLLKIGYNQL